MSTESFIGRVKWFNNKTGYGFITITDGQRSGNDIFVHHSAVNVEGQYKYLVQGEYVEFSIVDTPTGKHDCQAANVSGIKGGKLMCVTRHENNVARSAYKKEVRTNESTTSVASGKPNFRKAVSSREVPLVAESKTEESSPVPRQDKPRNQRKPTVDKTVAVEEGWTKVEPKKTAPSKPRGRPAKNQEAK
jgi:CspA family cold shock protein